MTGVRSGGGTEREEGTTHRQTEGQEETPWQSWDLEDWISETERPGRGGGRGGWGEAGRQCLPLGVEERAESEELDSAWTSTGTMSGKGPVSASFWSG